VPCSRSPSTQPALLIEPPVVAPEVSVGFLHMEHDKTPNSMIRPLTVSDWPIPSLRVYMEHDKTPNSMIRPLTVSDWPIPSLQVYMEHDKTPNSMIIPLTVSDWPIPSLRVYMPRVL